MIKAIKLPESEQTEYCKWVVHHEGKSYRLNKFTGGGTWWDCELNGKSLFGENTKQDLLSTLAEYLNHKECDERKERQGS